MKKLQTKNKPAAELVDLLKKKVAEAKRSALEIKSGRIKNSRSLFNLRKDIARVKTALRQITQ